MRVVYSYLIGDLFHYGHLRMLESAKKAGDFHICGVIGDDIVKKWAPPLICRLEERMEVIAKIKYVDEAIIQSSLDPTDNLKTIYNRFPNATILLVQNHILGGSSILGMEFIKEIKGKIINHNFYSNLSRDQIQRIFVKDFSENHDLDKIKITNLRIGDFDYFKKHFSTKANTIQSLREVLKNATIEKEFIFTVKEWMAEEPEILRIISETFGKTNIIIRSSSLNEDSIDFSNAGHYESVLNIDSSDINIIKAAISQVIESYENADNHLSENQILVQKQTSNVAISGVVFTRNLWTNTPYYLINFDDDSSRTDSVTSGLVNKKVEILKGIDLDKSNSKWYSLITAVREIEDFFKGLTLDIEFAIKENGEVIIFQVRPLAANSRFFSLDEEIIKQKVFKLQNQYRLLCESYRHIYRNQVHFDNLILSDMAFWNPAELIGDRPNYLDYSLFNHLLMKTTWNEALIPLGYTKVSLPLMEFFGSKPYIITLNAFLSLLPEDLPADLKGRLIMFYNKKLKEHPELHDKIEFEIVHNCYRFDYDFPDKELIDNGFTRDENLTLKESLLKLTNSVLLSYDKIIEKDTADIIDLEHRFTEIQKKCNPGLHWYSSLDKRISNSSLNWNEALNLIYQLIEDCKQLGTEQFSRIARMAFIGNALLRSLWNTKGISEKDYKDLFNSISTVASDMDMDFRSLKNGNQTAEQFLAKYGHLRPGTYDITKLPYDKNPLYITITGNGVSQDSYKQVNNDLSFQEISSKISPGIDMVCKDHNILVDGTTILDFIKRTTELREFYKFIYTKNISLALELIADVGEEFGFSRERFANVDYYTLVACRESYSREEAINALGYLINGRIEGKRINSQISLPPIIASEEDFVIVKNFVARPNFITDSFISGKVVLLDNDYGNIDLKGKIILVEKADPGYDWIFTKNIKALITKYGGAASHMAIRCAEFNIPAAIGCGDLLFSKLRNAEIVTMDCKNRKLDIF